MIKKQVDFSVTVRPFTEPIPPQSILDGIKHDYPFNDGWELMSTEIAQVSGNQIFVAYTFIRYEYVSDTVSIKAK